MGILFIFDISGQKALFFYGFKCSKSWSGSESCHIQFANSQAIVCKLPATVLGSDLISNQFLSTAIHLDGLAHRSSCHQ